MNENTITAYLTNKMDMSLSTTNDKYNYDILSWIGFYKTCRGYRVISDVSVFLNGINNFMPNEKDTNISISTEYTILSKF